MALLVRRVSLAAHPRIGGEYVVFCCLCFCCMGSPPHRRGIPGKTFEGAMKNGLTPA